MSHRVWAVAGAMILMAALPAAAQQRPMLANELALEPFAGAFLDGWDAGATGSRAGVLAGVRGGYALSDRARLLATIALGESNDVSAPADPANYFVYGNDYIALTTGAAYTVVPGRTSGSVGLELGVIWRGLEEEGTVGAPLGAAPFAGGDYTPFFVVVPTLSLERALTQRVSLALRLQDYFMDAQEHSPALTVGVSFR